MLKRLALQNVGPAPCLELEFGKRLNLLTGDNGLGKTFLLDIAWWALTRSWPAEINRNLLSGNMARPSGPGPASIQFDFSAKSRQEQYQSTFDQKRQAWTSRSGHPAQPGLVLYAQTDGSFALWDPARNYWRNQGNVDDLLVSTVSRAAKILEILNYLQTQENVGDRPPAYVFSVAEIWDGLKNKQGKPLCNGLIADWAGWQKERSASFEILTRVLEHLSPDPRELIQPGPLTRISLDDPRDIPTLNLPYGQNVPILHASAGIRRIVAFSYLLTWAWQEHNHACKLLGMEKAHQFIFLIDEIETHLHPKWQRTIFKALLELVQQMGEAANAPIQIITTTHSPLILASLETRFDPDQDAWFDLDLIHDSAGSSHVKITKQDFIRHGEVSNWLTSNAFDLASGRSLEAEKAMKEAEEIMCQEAFDANQAREIENKLRAVLGDIDPFWFGWNFFMEKKGWNT